MLRPRADLDPRLLVEFAVAFDEPGLQRVDDHRRRFVEALARFVHAHAKRGELAPRQAAAETQAQPSLAQQVEHRRLLRDPQRVVPGDDDRGGAQIDVRARRRQIAHQLEVVGDERVVVEVMLGRPQTVEAEIGGEPREADFLVPHALVGTVVPAVAGEHHHHADIHRPLRRVCFVGTKPAPVPDSRPRPQPHSARGTWGGRRCSA